jgi:peptide/nickel transport system permease protein
VLQGAILLFALTFLVINLVVDLLYTRIDPRIRR